MAAVAGPAEAPLIHQMSRDERYSDDVLRTRPRGPCIRPRAGLIFVIVGLVLFVSVITLSVTLNIKRAPENVVTKRAPRVLIIGGDFGLTGENVSNSVEVFDVRTQTFSSGIHLPSARAFLAATAIGKTVYAIGGNSSNETNLNPLTTTESLDLNASTPSWQPADSMLTPRERLTVVSLPTTLFAIGGWNGSDELSTIEAFDLANRTWKNLPSMPTKRGGVVAGLIGNELVVAGGSFRNVTEKYNAIRGEWTTTNSTPMESGREGPCATVLNGTLYVMGGLSENGTFLASAEVFNVRNNSWRPIANMAVPRQFCGAAAVNGRVYVFGGMNEKALDSVEVYDPETETWTTLPVKMGMARCKFGIATIYE